MRRKIKKKNQSKLLFKQEYYIYFKKKYNLKTWNIFTAYAESLGFSTSFSFNTIFFLLICFDSDIYRQHIQTESKILYGTARGYWVHWFPQNHLYRLRIASAENWKPYFRCINISMFPLVAKSFSWGEEVRGKHRKLIMTFCAFVNRETFGRVIDFRRARWRVKLSL